MDPDRWAAGKRLEVRLQLRSDEVVAYDGLMVPYRPPMRIAALVCFCTFLPLPIEAQLPESGPELYEIGCAKCHGTNGRGVDSSLVGFTAPLPDFTDCRFA